MSKGWNDTTPRFLTEKKHHVDRPPVMDNYPLYCWCGEQHHQPDPERPQYWSAGIHPWPPLDPEDT